MTGEQVLELIGVEHAAEGFEDETPAAPDADEAPADEQDDDQDDDQDGATGHCGLCGLTDDEDAWDRLSDELGVPVSLHRSDDLSPEEMPVVREVGTPCVLARFDENEYHAVVLSERLELFGGDVTRLLREVRLVAEQQGWRLGSSAAVDPDVHETI